MKLNSINTKKKKHGCQFTEGRSTYREMAQKRYQAYYFNKCWYE